MVSDGEVKVEVFYTVFFFLSMQCFFTHHIKRAVRLRRPRSEGKGDTYCVGAAVNLNCTPEFLTDLTETG